MGSLGEQCFQCCGLICNKALVPLVLLAPAAQKHLMAIQIRFRLARILHGAGRRVPEIALRFSGGKGWCAEEQLC